MNLRKVAFVAEIVSAVAVTVSLVFVGVQIRGNTAASEAAGRNFSGAFLGYAKQVRAEPAR